MSKGHTKRCLAQLLVLTGSLLLLCVPGHAKDLPAKAVPQTEKRLLVIAPHPDDESLAGAALIQKTLQHGGSVRVVVMTNGDGFLRAAAERFHVKKPQPSDLYRLGLVRQQEELAAGKRLGLQERDILFLGYPDAGLRHLWSGHWSSKSPFTGLNGHRQVPYPRAYKPGSPYCGQAVTDDLRRVLTEYRPTDLLYPDAHDVHGDHWATSAFTQYALAGLPLFPKEWTYLIHYPEFPMPRSYQPTTALLQPDRLQDVGIGWRTVPLGLSGIDQKRAAILAHQSQMQVMKELLTSFVRQNDLIGRTGMLHIPSDGKGVVLRDPDGDQNGNAAVDIRNLTVTRTKKQLQLCIELARPVSAKHRFSVHLRLPEASASETAQYELKLSDHKLNIILYPELNSRVAQDISWQLHDRQLFLSLPVTPFRDVSCLMIGTEVKLEGSVDRTAWRRLYL